MGAGTYPDPEPIQSSDKIYQFDFIASISGYGIVTASNIEQAKELIDKEKYDDIIETFGMKIEEITSIKEE